MYVCMYIYFTHSSQLPVLDLAYHVNVASKQVVGFLDFMICVIGQPENDPTCER